MRLFLLFLLPLLLSACIDRPTDLPLPEDKLVAILMDLHLAEAAFQSLSTSAKDTLAYQYYDQVYEMHSVDKNAVDACLVLLNNRPQQFFEVYEKVKTGLEESAAKNLENRPRPGKKMR